MDAKLEEDVASAGAKMEGFHMKEMEIAVVVDTAVDVLTVMVVLVAVVVHAVGKRVLRLS